MFNTNNVRIKKDESGITLYGKFASSEEMDRAKKLVKDLPNGTYKTNQDITKLSLRR